MDKKYCNSVSANKIDRPCSFRMGIILAAIIATAFLALPVCSYAVDYGADPDTLTIEEAAKRSDVPLEVYDELGLTMDLTVPEGKAGPLSDSHAITLVDRREVYTAANGSKSKLYVVRDGLDILGPADGSSQGHSDMKSGDGASWGAYKLWDINRNNMFEKHGNTLDSYLAGNKDVVMKKEASDFDGKYATSAAFSLKAGGEAKEDHVAELRAWHANCSQKYGSTGEWYKGLIEVCIFSFDEDGTRHKKTVLRPDLHESQFLDTDGYKELNYLDFGYLQEYDAYFEIEAADVDGDGIHELFAYTGAYEDVDGRRNAIVYMFRTTDGNNWSYSRVNVDTGPASNYPTINDLKDANSKQWRRMTVRMAPVVTLAACDLDRNGSEEIAITTSAPAGHKDAKEASCARIFHWDKGKKNVVTVSGLENIRLSGSGDKGLTSANCASGVFNYIDSDHQYYINTLIFAGWETNDKTSDCETEWKRFGYRYVFYNPEKQKYELSDYSTQTLGKDAKIIAGSAAKNKSGGGRYMTTMAPFALGCARLETVKGGTVLPDYVLAGGDIYSFALSDDAKSGTLKGLGRSYGSMSLFSGQYHHQSGVAEINKPKDHIWIGDVVSGCVTTGEENNESFLAVIGVRRDSDVRGSDDYYWFDVAHFTFGKGNSGKRYTGQEGVINESTRMGNVSGPNISLCLPDLDNDSVRARLIEQAVFPTVPQVLAVLQDAPYFSDLQETYGYLSESFTAFGRSTEQTTGKGINERFGAGGRFFVEFNLGGYVNVDAAAKVASNYDKQWQNSHGTGITYTAEGGKGDKAVIYSVPYLYSYYEVYNPDSGTWEGMMQTEALEPCTSVVSINKWDSIAKGRSLPLLGNTPDNPNPVLRSSSGKPETYTRQNLGGSEYAYSKNTVGTRSDTGEGAFIALEANEGRGTSWNTGLGLEINICNDVGLGVVFGKIGLGVVVDAAAGYEESVVDIDSTNFTGGPDNLPVCHGVSGTGGKYAFECRLRVNVIDRDKGDDDGRQWKRAGKDVVADDIYVIGYEVFNVETPDLRMVPDTSIDEVYSDGVRLSWQQMDFGNTDKMGTAYYRVGILDSAGSGEVASWHYIEADAHPEPVGGRIGRVSYILDGLDPQKQYSFRVQAVRGTMSGSSFSVSASSIPSPELKVVTLKEGEVIKLLSGPESLDTLQQGDNAEYTARAHWTIMKDGEQVDNSGNIDYFWEFWNSKDQKWEEFGNGHGNSIIEKGPFYKDITYGTKSRGESYTETKLILKSVSAAQNGMPIRCKAGFSDHLISSYETVLRVNGEIERPVITGYMKTTWTGTSLSDALWFRTAQKGEGRYGSVEDEINKSDDDKDKDNDNDNDNEKKNDYGGKNVKTGDDSRPAVWITLMIISLICLCAAMFIRRRRA